MDISPEFLALAAEEAALDGVQATYQHQDMRQLDFAGELAAAIYLCTPFGYSDDAENAQVWANGTPTLRHEGRFLLDTVNRDGLMAHFPIAATQLGDHLETAQVSFNPITGFLPHHRVTVRAGKVRKVDFSVAWSSHPRSKPCHTPPSFQKCFYGGWQGGPLERTSQRMLVLATK